MNRPAFLKRRGAARRRRVAMAAAALVVVLLPVSVGGGSRTAPRSASAEASVSRLDLDVTVDAAQRSLAVVADVYLALEGVRGSEIALVMTSPARIVDVTPPAGARADVFETGTGRGKRVGARVTLPAPRAPGTEVRVRVRAAHPGGAFQVAVSGTAALASWVAGWYPMPRGDRAAPGITRLRVPEGWRALSNGALVSDSVEDGVRVQTWRTTAAVARSFVAGPYHVQRVAVGDREVGAYVLDHADRAGSIAGGLAGTLAALEDRLGPYPYDAYAVAEIPNDLVEWYGSSEQGFFMAKSAGFEAPGGVNLPLFAHELAHGWWGNRVRSRGNKGTLLLNEALAQYGAVLAIEAIEGDSAATDFLRFSRPGYNPVQCARGFFQMWRDGDDKALSQLTGDPPDHNLSDAKGHWVYHMLRQLVGDDAFFDTLRHLIATYGGAEMSLDDLRRAFVDRAPDRSATERFLAQWLDRPGAPVLDATLVRYADGVATVRVTQGTEPYRLNVELGFRRAGRSVLHVVRLSGRRSEEFRIEAPAAPDTIAVDPRHRLLVWDPAYGDRPTPR